MKTLLLTALLLSTSALSATHDGQNIDGHDYKCRGVRTTETYHFNQQLPDKIFRFGYGDNPDPSVTCRFLDQYLFITYQYQSATITYSAYIPNDSIPNPFFAFNHQVRAEDYSDINEWLYNETYKVFIYY